jgi:flagellar L-ring protein precursor FlgH
MYLHRAVLLVPLFLLLSPCAPARHQKIQRETLADYIRRVEQPPPDLRASSLGSLWTDQGRLAAISTDYKATHVGDLITILVVQDVKASSAGNVATDRSFKASSGIDGLAGHISTSGVQNIFSPRSSATLSGKAQATSDSSLRTSLAGRVAAVLTNGVMVVEAEREVTMNSERQTILVRGMVRPGDVSPDNTVLSNAIGNLELELKGKGVISDGTRPPNPLVRLLLRLVGF